MKRTWLKRIGLFLLACLVLFLILNFEFVRKNITFVVSGPALLAQTKPADLQVAKFEPDKLSIPSLNVSAPIVYISAKNEKAYQDALKEGVVHFPGTAKPGEFGNCYIFGHSSDYVWSKGKYKTVFALLPQIAIGADIEVSGHDGTVYHYMVIDSRVVEAKDLSVLSQFDYKKKLLTLQASYPIGTALKRWIVVAEMK